MDAGSIAFMITCANPVSLMTPGLAFFYGGLGRHKNVINITMMCVTSIAVAPVMWVICGYSLSFGGDESLIGNSSHLFFNGVSGTASTRGLETPDVLFATLQTMFPVITAAILTGAAAGRIRFTPLTIFIIFRLLLVYFPFAHMVWDERLLAQWGIINSAGGDVIHITSGVSGLVSVLVLGKRRDYNHLEYRPHNVPSVFLGAGSLWFGWFGSNAGSALAADGLAVHAFVTTHTSTAAIMLSRSLARKVLTGEFPLVGASTGPVAGLVAIMPGAGFVSTWSPLFIGLCVSPVCYFAISVLKSKSDYDDALDVFGCHGTGGTFDGLVTGLFTISELTLDGNNIGLIYGSAHLSLVTIAAIIFTIVWSATATFVIIKVISILTSTRVEDRAEATDLDDSEHEETAYPTSMGFDS